MKAAGTLGNKWQRWQRADSHACDCDNCCVLHDAHGDIMVWGQCARCPRDSNGEMKAHRIDLNGEALGTNFSRVQMKCGHRPVGLTNVWVNLKEGWRGARRRVVRGYSMIGMCVDTCVFGWCYFLRV